MRSLSSSDRINIAASAQKVDVDHRLPLRIYFRIADNILKQADIFRQERNIIDLYIMLLRFSRRQFPVIASLKHLFKDKVYLTKKLLNALKELEELQPAVKRKNDEFNRRNEIRNNGWVRNHQIDSVVQSPQKNQNLISYDVTKEVRPVAGKHVYQPPRVQYSYARPVEEQLRNSIISLPCPTEETLSRHSILGPNGLRGQWQPPKSDIGIGCSTSEKEDEL